MENDTFECQYRQNRWEEAEIRHSSKSKIGGFLLYCLKYSFSIIDFGVYLVDFCFQHFHDAS